MRSDTELLVLTLIGRGVSAAYALAAQAGLSPGTTVPLLNRLTKAGLIKIGPEGSRGRRDCALTSAGRKVLLSEAAGLIDRPPTDLDSALRTIFVSFPLIENGRRANFLRGVISHLRTAAKGRKLDANRPADADSPEQYRSMKWLAESRRLKADIATLESLLSEVNRTKIAPKSRQKTRE